ALSEKRQVYSLTLCGLKSSAVTLAARVSEIRAAMFFRTAGLTLGAVVTFNTSRVRPPPGETVTSIAVPSWARTRPAGPVIVPAGPVPPIVVVASLRAGGRMHAAGG